MSSFYYPDSPPKVLMEILESTIAFGRNVADASDLCCPSSIGISFSFLQNL